MEMTKKQQLFQNVISKAWEDEDFKAALVANPAKAIEKLTGSNIKLPKGKTLTVVDQTDESLIYINIPVKPNLEDMELNEEQLELVAGGDFWGAVGAIVLGPVTLLTEGKDAYIDSIANEL